MKVYDSLLKLIFTESCPSCGGGSDGGFCTVCAAAFARVRRPCSGCGLAEPVIPCPRRLAPWHVDVVVAPFVYCPPIDHYIHALKYRGTRNLGRAFALLLAPTLHATRANVDALVAVPLHRTRLLERGYNQAIEIARTVACELKLPLLQRGIARRIASRAQTRQTASQRRLNVADAFVVERPLAGRNIAIVDDVLTTGATVNALAAALRTAGAASCAAWAVARTPAA